MKSLVRNVGWKKRHLALAALGVYACSFQDFDYLKNSVGGAGNDPVGGAGASPGGRSNGGDGGGEGPSAGNSGVGGVAGTGAGQSNGGNGTAGVVSPAGGDSGAGGEAGEDGIGEGGSGNFGGSGGTGGVSGMSPMGGTAGVAGAPNKATISNPSFEEGLRGWIIDPPSSANNYVYTQTPPTGSSTVDGRYFLSVWDDVDEYAFYVYQRLEGVEPGTYTFKGHFSTGPLRALYVFVRDCGGEDRQEDIGLNSFPWAQAGITGIEVTDGTCEVGFFVQGLPISDWMNADLFSFEREE